MVYAYPRLFSFVGHTLVSANEMFNYYIDLFRDTLLILGIGLASEIRNARLTFLLVFSYPRL